MALPVISNNSPSAGRIAWTAFSIVWDGISYPIAAGNTNQPYTWWEYRNGTPAVVSGATLPTLGVADLLLFLNKNGLGVVAPLTDVVEGSLIVPGTVMGTAIAANEIQTDHLRAGSVTAPIIAGGAVTAEKLSVGAVSDSKVVNGSFEDGVQGWERMAGTGIADVVTGVASAGANALRLTRGTVDNLHVGTALDKSIPVTSSAGRAWYIAARAGAGATLPDGFYLRAYWYQANRTTAASTAFTDIASNQGLSSSWAMFEGQATPPANARYMRVVVINARSGSVMYVDEVTAREVVMSAQIGEGQITTPLLAANAVKAGNIDVETLNGLQITGLLLRSAAAGRRVEVRENRIDVYDVNGELAGSIMGSDESGANGGIITIGRVAGPNNSAGLYTVEIGQQHLPAGGSIGFEVIGAHIEELYLNQAPRDYATGQLLQPALAAQSKGTTVLAHGQWVGLNTSATTGTDRRNDGYTYGPADIDVPRPGMYLVAATVLVPGNGNGDLRALRIRTDLVTSTGDDVPANHNRTRSGQMPTSNVVLQVIAIVPANSWFSVEAYQNSGGNIGGVQLAYISALRVG